MAGPQERSLVEAMPPWLRRTYGGKLVRAFGITLDAIADRSADAMAARLPSEALPDALPYIGRDRKIVRGLDESDASYAGRLRRWLPDHKRRGGGIALLRQLEAYYASSPKQIDLVYETGTRYTLGPDGTITKDSIEWREGSDPAAWAQAFVFVRYDAEPFVSYAEAQSVVSIVREWMPGHIQNFYVWGVYPGGGDLWDYPDGVLWDADDPVLWDDEDAIDFMTLTDVRAVTIGGAYLTVGGRRVVVRT